MEEGLLGGKEVVVCLAGRSQPQVSTRIAVLDGLGKGPSCGLVPRGARSRLFGEEELRENRWEWGDGSSKG